MFSRHFCVIAVAPLALASCFDSAPTPAPFVDGTCRGPGETFVLAEHEDQIQQIAVHGDYVYWTSSRGPRRVHRNGGPVEDLAIPDVTRDTSLPPNTLSFGLYVDDSYVYFGSGIERVGIGLWRVPLTGGDPELAARFVGGGAAREIRGDDRSIWSLDLEFGGIFRVEKRAAPGGAVMNVAGGRTDTRGLAIDETRVWWGGFSVEKDGFDFRSRDVGGVDSIAVIGDVVYYGYEQGVIAPRQRDGTTLPSLSTDHVKGLVAYGGRLFWARPGPDGGYGTAAADGTGLTVTPIGDAPNTRAIAVDDGAIYLHSHPPLEDRIVKVCR